MENCTNNSTIMVKCTNTTTTMQDKCTILYLTPVKWNWMLIVQLLLAITGITGNSLVIHIFRRSRKLVQSSTNTLIAALATADVITSISIIPRPSLSCVPNNVAGSLYCKIVFSSVVMWISIVASIFTLTALSIERYVAIAYPTRYRNIFTMKTSRKIIAGIWLSAFVVNTFCFYVNHLGTNQCYVDFLSTAFQKFIGASIFIVEYALPVTIMLITNVRAVQILKLQASNISSKNTKKGTTKICHTLSLLRARRRVIIMLLVVIISFIICWSPDQFAFLAFNMGLVEPQYLYGVLYSFFVVLAFANSCVNPIIYTFVNRNFREAIKQQLPVYCREKKYSDNTLFETPVDDSGGSGSTKVSRTGSSSDVKKERALDMLDARK